MTYKMGKWDCRRMNVEVRTIMNIGFWPCRKVELSAAKRAGWCFEKPTIDARAAEVVTTGGEDRESDMGVEHSMSKWEG